MKLFFEICKEKLEKLSFQKIITYYFDGIFQSFFQESDERNMANNGVTPHRVYI